MRIKAGLVLFLAMVGASAAQAQDKYPSKPIKIVLPYGPGSATDIITRIMCEQLRQSLGQSCVVENKPGAFGIIAIEEMARARPDGYTLQVGNVSTNAITPVLFKSKFTIDYERDVVAVARLADLPTFLMATARNSALWSCAGMRLKSVISISNVGRPSKGFLSRRGRGAKSMGRS